MMEIGPWSEFQFLAGLRPPVLAKMDLTQFQVSPRVEGTVRQGLPKIFLGPCQVTAIMIDFPRSNQRFLQKFSFQRAPEPPPSLSLHQDSD